MNSIPRDGSSSRSGHPGYIYLIVSDWLSSAHSREAGVVLQKLLDQIDVSHDHSSAAITFEGQRVHSVAGF